MLDTVAHVSDAVLIQLKAMTEFALMEGAPPVSKKRVATLCSELEQVHKLVEVYLRRHFNTLAENSVKVRQLLLSNMNIGLHEGMQALAVQGGELYRKHTYAAPAPEQGILWSAPPSKH